MSVTITGTTYLADWPHASDTTFEVRAQSDRAWVTEDLVVVPAREPHVVGTGTITALRPTLPNITLPATSAGLDDQTARWTVTLHRTGRKQPVSTVLADFPLPSSFEPNVTWAQIKINKNGKQPLLDTSVYTKTETNHQIDLALNAANVVPATRTLTATYPLRIGGGASADLSANRTLSFLSTVFDPLNYGAVGDGTTNDTVAVQAAVTALNAAGGGTLLLSKLFLVSGTGSQILLITAPCRIVGLGWNTGLKLATGTTAKVIRFAPPLPVDGATLVPAVPYAGVGAAVENFAIWPQTSGQGGDAIFLDGSLVNGNCGFFRNFRADQIFIGQLNTASYGITGDNGANPNGVPGPGTLITNSEFRRGLKFVTNGDSVAIRDSRFAGPGTAIEATNVAGATTLLLDHLNIISSGGVWIKGPQVGVAILDCIIELAAAATMGGQLEGVDPFGHDNAVVSIDGTGGTIYNVRLIGNTISNLGGATELDGVRLHGILGATLDNNYIYVRGTRNNIIGTSTALGVTALTNFYVGPSTKATFGGWDRSINTVLQFGTAVFQGGSTEFNNQISNLYQDVAGDWRAISAAASGIVSIAGGQVTFFTQGSALAGAIVPLVNRGSIGTSGWKIGSVGTNNTFRRFGRLTLVAGVATVADANVTANTNIILHRQIDGGTVAASYSVTRSAGVSFTVTAKDGAGANQTADTSTLAYEMIEP